MHKLSVAASLAMAALLISVSGCKESGSQTTEVIDQAYLCEVSSWQAQDVSAACKPGQKVVFLPSSFGNEQLPIIFAALNCDLRYTVALTKGGVSCIYTPTSIGKPQADNKSEAPAKP